MTSPTPPRPVHSSPNAPLRFRHVAIVGKYQALGSRDALDGIAHFLHGEGCDVAMERDTAHNTGLSQYGALGVDEIGARCDLALVVGGDGTMLGIARQLARFGVPLVGINQGRLGFITDVAYGDYPEKLRPMLRGTFDEDRRACLAAGMNDFLVKPLTHGSLREVLSRWTGRPGEAAEPASGWTKSPTRAKVAG